MALSNMPFFLVQPPQKLQFLFNQLFIFFLLLLPSAMSISFNFPSFNTDNSNLILQGDAYTNPDGPSQRILLAAPSAEVLVVPYIMNEFTFGIIAQGSLTLQTSPRTSPLSLKLSISLLLMGLLSSSHHLILRFLTIQQAGILDCLVMKPLSTALKIKLLPLSLTLSKTGGIQVLLMWESISIPLSQT